MPSTREVASWASRLTWATLPDSVRQRAVSVFSDALSVMAAGTQTTASQIAADVVRGRRGEVPLFAGGTSDAAGAAFANGVAAAALDYEDGHREGGAIHPGGVILAAALASTKSETTNAQLLTALVAGYEVALRAAYLLWPKSSTDWYHSTGTAGSLGAAVASARIRGLDEDGLYRTLVIAWSHAPMATFALPMTKEAIGWGAHVGLSAAELAEAGFMRLPDGYEPPEVDAFPASPFDRPEARDEAFVSSLGTTWETLNTYFKAFASCGYTHAAASGLMTLLTPEVSPEHIADIEVGTHRGALFLSDPQPRTLEHAQYSFPFVLASVAVRGSAGAEDIAESRLDDPRVLDLARRVRVVHNPEMDDAYPDHYGSRVTVTLAGGEVRSGTFLDAPDPTDAVLRDKWHDLLASRMGSRAAQRVLSEICQPDQTVERLLSPLWTSAPRPEIHLPSDNEKRNHR